jgi:hypothetical protein
LLFFFQSVRGKLSLFHLIRFVVGGRARAIASICARICLDVQTDRANKRTDPRGHCSRAHVSQTCRYRDLFFELDGTGSAVWCRNRQYREVSNKSIWPLSLETTIATCICLSIVKPNTMPVKIFFHFSRGFGLTDALKISSVKRLKLMIDGRLV